MNHDEYRYLRVHVAMKDVTHAFCASYRVALYRVETFKRSPIVDPRESEGLLKFKRLVPPGCQVPRAPVLR